MSTMISAPYLPNLDWSIASANTWLMLGSVLIVGGGHLAALVALVRQVRAERDERARALGEARARNAALSPASTKHAQPQAHRFD